MWKAAQRENKVLKEDMDQRYSEDFDTMDSGKPVLTSEVKARSFLGSAFDA